MEDELQRSLSNTELSRKEKIMLILNAQTDGVQVKDIVAIGVENGLREIQKWHISGVLNSLKGHVVKLPNGWGINSNGRKHLSELGILDVAPTQVIKPTLRKYALQISNTNVKEFAEEAISALEVGLLRSAVVLSWVGAVSILYEEVVGKHLVGFNAEAKKRNARWKDAKNADGLSKMKEYDFLQIIHSISVIGKNVKDELEQCLKLRNSCGHPNSLKLGEHKVSSHVEMLILNVYSKFSI